jgi:hypothetical protein
MSHRDLALVQGLDHTRATLRRWNGAPWRVVGLWALGSLAVSAALLYLVWAISHRVTPDTRELLLPGINEPVGLTAVAQVLARNSLVLALHAFACVAGFIAGSSLPLSTEQRTGFSRWIHEKARPVAFAWVVAVTCFSLGTQAYVLGSTGATLAHQLHISPAVLMVTVLPHALPELTALFLPLAAWTIASRRGEWGDLLAATLVTVTLAVPTLVCAALWETYVWPHLLRAVSPIA